MNIMLVQFYNYRPQTCINIIIYVITHNQLLKYMLRKKNASLRISCLPAHLQIIYQNDINIRHILVIKRNGGINNNNTKFSFKVNLNYVDTIYRIKLTFKIKHVFVFANFNNSYFITNTSPIEKSDLHSIKTKIKQVLFIYLGIIELIIINAG